MVCPDEEFPKTNVSLCFEVTITIMGTNLVVFQFLEEGESEVVLTLVLIYEGTPIFLVAS